MICIYIHIYIYIYICIYIYTYIYTYIHIYTRIYIYIHLYIYMHSCQSGWFHVFTYSYNNMIHMRIFSQSGIHKDKQSQTVACWLPNPYLGWFVPPHANDTLVYRCGSDMTMLAMGVSENRGSLYHHDRHFGWEHEVPHKFIILGNPREFPSPIELRTFYPNDIHKQKHIQKDTPCSLWHSHDIPMFPSFFRLIPILHVAVKPDVQSLPDFLRNNTILGPESGGTVPCKAVRQTNSINWCF